MKSVLFMVLFILLSVAVYATPVEPQSITNSLTTISINSQEEVVGQSQFCEILAIKPVGIKQSWLPLYNQDGYNGKITTTLKSNIPIGKIYNRIQRRIRSPA